MPRGKVKTSTDPPPPTNRVLETHQLEELILQRVIATRKVHTRLEAERARVLSKLSALVSDMRKRPIPDPSEIENFPLIEQRLIMKSITFGSLTDPPLPTYVDHRTFERVDELHTRLEAELHRQSRILSILTALVTEPPQIKIPTQDIQEEIMKRLPVKSLVRLRCVSKTWKSVINSSEFIRTHKNRPQYLLVECCNENEDAAHYVSFADNELFPNWSFVPALPPSISLPFIAGSSYGLLCFYCCYPGKKARAAVIWNPCIRRSISIDVPPREELSEVDVFVAFGVCPLTLDPKVVHITHLCPPEARRKSESETKKFGGFWKVNVYKLSSGKFTTLSRSSRLPPVSRRIVRFSTHVFIDRHIYWLAEKDAPTSLIMSFDITDEKFKALPLPDTLATLSTFYLSLSKLRESLVMFQYDERKSCYAVWKMMDDGLSFTKMFTINAPCPALSIRAVGFRKTGGPIMEVYGSKLRDTRALVAYVEPDSRDCKVLIPGCADSYTEEFYTETLLLIGRSDTTSF